MTVCAARCHAQCVVDAAAAGLVETDQSRQNGKTSGIGRRPSLGPPAVGREIEHGARPGFPSPARIVPTGGVQFVEHPPLAIDDEHVPVAIGAAARLAALDVVPLRFCRRGNRIATLAAISRVALGAVCDEGDRHARLSGSHTHVWNAVRRRPEVGMQPAIAPDKTDVRARPRIDGSP